jgi:uncharacterized protein YxjI
VNVDVNVVVDVNGRLIVKKPSTITTTSTGKNTYGIEEKIDSVLDQS